MVQQLQGHAGILGGNKIRRAKCSRHPRRHIVQVANGRGNNIQNSGHGVLLLSFTAPNVSNTLRGFASVFIIGIFAPGCKTAEKFNFFLQPSENPVFSRLFASVILKPYVFSLVFALMSENKGNFLLFTADYLVQQPCGGTLRFPCSVSVDIHCGTDISVSEKLLHIFRCRPI